MNKKVCNAGILSICIGILCFVIKAFTPEYVDESGVLHESFYLLPIGYLFLLIGIVVCIVCGIIKIIKK